MSAKGRVVFDGIKAMRASFSPFDPRTRGLNELLVRVQAARAKDGAAKTTIEASVRRGAKPAFEVVYEDGRVNTFDGAQPNVVAKVMRALADTQQLDALKAACAKDKRPLPKWHSMGQPSWQLLQALRDDPGMFNASRATGHIPAIEGELAGKGLDDVNADGLHYFSPYLRGVREGPPPPIAKPRKVEKTV
eukprot:PRCOL_00003460-RA